MWEILICPSGVATLFHRDQGALVLDPPLLSSCEKRCTLLLPRQNKQVSCVLASFGPPITYFERRSQLVLCGDLPCGLVMLCVTMDVLVADKMPVFLLPRKGKRQQLVAIRIICLEQCLAGNAGNSRKKTRCRLDTRFVWLFVCSATHEPCNASFVFVLFQNLQLFSTPASLDGRSGDASRVSAQKTVTSPEKPLRSTRSERFVAKRKRRVLNLW